MPAIHGLAPVAMVYRPPRGLVTTTYFPAPHPGTSQEDSPPGR
jgi:hypothetical protein